MQKSLIGGGVIFYSPKIAVKIIGAGPKGNGRSLGGPLE